MYHEGNLHLSYICIFGWMLERVIGCSACPSYREAREVGDEGQGQYGFLGCLAHDLPGPSVSCHARLGGTLVGAHLQTDDILPPLNLVIREVSAVLLSFPAEKKAALVTILLF